MPTVTHVIGEIGHVAWIATLLPAVRLISAVKGLGGYQNVEDY